MKVLIFYANAGGGHKSAANTLAAYLSQNLPDCEAIAVDAMANIGKFEDFICCSGYKFLAKRAPWGFGLLYRATNRTSPLQHLLDRFTSIFSKRLLRCMEREQPDVILSAYPLATSMISLLKTEGLLKVPFLTVLTDYGPHRAWIGPGVDAYAVATKDMIPSMVKMGAQQEKIYPLGIPVLPGFFDSRSRVSLRKEFGLTPDLPAILIMAGSFGVNNIIGIYRRLAELPDEFQAVVITGNNTKLFRAFEKELMKKKKCTKLVGFTDRVADYMAACDLLVTKPGGLTTSEALAMNIPLCVFNAIPGQEEDNADFLLRHNMAVRVDKNTCAETVGALLREPERLARMKQACEAFDKSGSLPSIAKLVQKLAESNR